MAMMVFNSKSGKFLNFQCNDGFQSKSGKFLDFQSKSGKFLDFQSKNATFFEKQNHLNLQNTITALHSTPEIKKSSF
jgi:hypothetical protein